MNILGLDALVIAVDDLSGCTTFLLDYGLTPIDPSAEGGRFAALDGTAVILRRTDDPGLPAPTLHRTGIRETVYGVDRLETLDRIAKNLGEDRVVRRGLNGSVHTLDDAGFAIAFQVTTRRPYTAPPTLTNSPGASPQRGPNQLGVDLNMKALPRTLSHVVYLVPDVAKAEAFYADRLGFKVTDRFAGGGPFMRPAGTLEHHTLFLIQNPAKIKAVDHFAFHVGNGTEMLLAGSRFSEKGYKTFWGPGRHLLGSNWFWYFASPLGCKIEYDADMDLHDDTWRPREVPFSFDTTQLFHFAPRPKFMPGGGHAPE